MSHGTSTMIETLRKELISRYSVAPTDQWLTIFLSTVSRPPPLPALTSTAHFRLMSTDFTVSLDARPPGLLPANVGDVHVKSMLLQAKVPVQVLDIVDTSTSNYSQIEAIERVERGEEIRGREVIRNVPVASSNGEDDAEGSRQINRGGSAGTGSTPAGASKRGTTGPHKLLLQDAAGTKTWAFELSRIEKFTIINTMPTLAEVTTQVPPEGMQIGCKILLEPGTIVRRGLIMLTPSTATFMGGKVESWDKKWREGRKIRLQRALEAENVS